MVLLVNFASSSVIFLATQSKACVWPRKNLNAVFGYSALRFILNYKVSTRKDVLGKGQNLQKNQNIFSTMWPLPFT